MKKYINKFKISIVYTLSLFMFCMIFTLLEYIGINYNICSIILIFINYIMIFIYAYISSMKSDIKGIKSGTKSGIKIIIILTIMNFIFLNKYGYKTIVYYLIIMIITIIGGIIGKNKIKK